ncbi:retrovirus-related pol polyprotein from transposon TNT 1-94 [Tanacetum coccineum]|uniref:Retrovirus-related pol polyprotein from transposon TNT 1-94 n=1 Tax=Tanacetum coccineum TaxID=301880 RepID=A0ABQ5HE12_9ASTR
MNADLKYVESLKDELDELESDKAEFSNMYDVLLQECVSKDVMLRDCDCLAQRLSNKLDFLWLTNTGNRSFLAMINLHQFLDTGIWFKEISRSRGFITSKASITIFSRLDNSVMSDLEVSISEIYGFLLENFGETTTNRLSHLNFDYINLLSKKDVVIGLPKLKYVKDQLCSSCEVSKEKRSSFKSKTVPSSKGRLNLLHMDLCGPMRVASINGIKYILASDYDNPDPAPELQNVSPSTDTTVPSQQELDLLFGPLYDEFFNDGSSRVTKSSSPIDHSIQKDTTPSMNIQPPSEPSTPTNVHAEENNDHQVEFTNPFCTPVQEIAEFSSCNIGTSNMHTFNQPQDSEY